MIFSIAPSPHTHLRRTTQHVMLYVLGALLPGIVALLYFFGWGVALQLAVAIPVALAAETCALMLRQRPVLRSLRDCSAIVTAVLLAVSIPPLAPWWVIVIGTLFAILVIKHIFGGLGHNIFNPAMAAYVLLLISFPVQMTSWMPFQDMPGFTAQSLQDSLALFLTGSNSQGFNLEQVRAIAQVSGVDAVAMATPLDYIKTEIARGFTLTEIMQTPLFTELTQDTMIGEAWSWVNLAFLFGGLFLLLQRIITWHIPITLLVTLTLISGLASALSVDLLPGASIHILSGGTMLAIFFIATDPVTAATSNRGKVYYALLIASLVYIIRTWGGYPDAFAFAVLLANLSVPLIDQYTRPQAYGHRKTTS